MERRDVIQLEVDVEVNWLVNDVCNFRCPYCYPGVRRNRTAGLSDTQAIVEAFRRTGKRWLIYLTGGEPFLMPGFVDLCQALTRDHLIAVNTNLAHGDVERWVRTIPANRVRSVHCSLHVTERERLGLVDDFVRNFHLLREAGFYAFVSYVLYPPLMNRFDHDYRFFRSKGITLRPKIYRGEYAPLLRCIPKRAHSLARPFVRPFVRRYPEQMSSAQRDQVLRWIDRSQAEGAFAENADGRSNPRVSDVEQDRLFVHGLPCFRGTPCNAGMNFVRMMPNGDVRRCYGDPTPLGNLLDGSLRLMEEPRACPSSCCPCPYIGYKHRVTAPADA